MKELKGKQVSRTPGFQADLKVRAFVIEPGDSSDDLKDGNDKKKD